MKILLNLLRLSSISSFVLAQDLDLVCTLPTEIQETSGLLFINQRLISHNDSGGQAELYELDTLTGSILRTVVVANASNVDWEDLAVDDNYLYIADIGNNNGTRTDLKIYRVSLDDYWNSVNDTVYADTINISYSDQTSFVSSPFTTNFDAEALVVSNNELFLFSKNWGNQSTRAYSIPKIPGSYQVDTVISIDVGFFVTGACASPDGLNLYLIGYDFSLAYFYTRTNLGFGEFINHKFNLFPPAGSSFQIEGIVEKEDQVFYVSSEALGSDAASLFLIDLRTTNGIGSKQFKEGLLSPNPTSDFIEIKDEAVHRFVLFNLSGQEVFAGQNKKISLAHLNEGLYWLLCYDKEGKELSANQVSIKK